MPRIARLCACAALVSVASCSDSPTGFLNDPERVGRAAESTAALAARAETVFDDLLDGAVAAGEYVDARDVEQALLEIDGVAAARIGPTGTVVSLRQRDGAWLNVPLARRADERLFVSTRGVPSKAPVQRVRGVVLPGGAPPAAVFPPGARALILAPFQHEFGEDLEAVAAPLRLAGFIVDVHQDQAAGIERFRGDFLSSYDLVYISSHGVADGTTRDGADAVTMVLAGTPAGRAADVALHGASRDQYAALGQFSLADGVYYGVSGEWIEATGGAFDQTFVYVNASESAAYDEGPGSLSAALLRMGAGGFTGWDQVVNNPLAHATPVRVVAGLSRGRSLQQAVNDVRTDLAFLLYGWFLRVRLPGDSEPVARIDQLDRRQPTADAYHLYDPARVVADMTVAPTSGAAGTAVAVEVRVRPDFVNLVTRVDLFISGTDERLAMSKVGDDLWRRTDLVAPTAATYPRVTTFTFLARRGDGVTVGRGSATFTTLGPAGSAAPSRWTGGGR
jgi:hypothetical protein